MVRKITKIIIVFLFLSQVAFGADIYWADTNGGAANWAACESDADPGAGNRCTVAQANAGAVAGDTVYLTDDANYTTNTTDDIDPQASGSAGNYITFEAASGDTPTFTGSAGARVEDVDYIKIKGITFHQGSSGPGACSGSSTASICIEDADYIIIDGITLTSPGSYYGMLIASGGGGDSDFVQVINSTFTGADYGSAEGDLLGVSDDSEHVLIQNNTFTNSPHALIYVGGGNDYLIIRDNTLENTWWTSFAVYPSDFVIIEDNIIKNTGTNHPPKYAWDGDSYDGAEVNADGNPNAPPRSTATAQETFYGAPQFNCNNNMLMRRNLIYNEDGEMDAGKWTLDGDAGSCGAADSNDKRIYNNTIYRIDVGFYHNSAGLQTGTELKNNIWSNIGTDCPSEYVASGKECHQVQVDLSTQAYSWSGNIWYSGSGTWWYRGDSSSDLVDARDDNVADFPESSPNSVNSEVNPGFTDTSTNDFTLGSGANAIDAGSFLTTVTQASGSGTSFTVGDARYFFDPDDWGAVAYPSNFGLSADTIKTENGETELIVAINYGTNTITVNSEITWTQGEGISINYSGSAPDIGYDEYGGVVEPEDPTTTSLEGLTIE